MPNVLLICIRLFGSDSFCVKHLMWKNINFFHYWQTPEQIQIQNTFCNRNQITIVTVCSKRVLAIFESHLLFRTCPFLRSFLFYSFFPDIQRYSRFIIEGCKMENGKKVATRQTHTTRSIIY